MDYTRDEITQILEQWSAGEPEALDQLMPLIFDEVRDIARRVFAGESPAHTLQTTALVNEVYLHLLGRRTVNWSNRKHFFGTLAQLMRRILVDHHRRHRRAKRGSGTPNLPLDEAIQVGNGRQPELVALDDALKDLEKLDSRQHKVVMLRYFMGLTQVQTADVLGVSRATVEREWATAKMWLERELSDS